MKPSGFIQSIWLPRRVEMRHLQQHQAQYKHLLGEITIWLISEVLLTVVGLDDIANYNEFLLNKNQVSTNSNTAIQSVIHSIG
jgi:hypothetical protein